MFLGVRMARDGSIAGIGCGDALWGCIVRENPWDGIHFQPHPRPHYQSMYVCVPLNLAAAVIPEPIRASTASNGFNGTTHPPPTLNVYAHPAT